MTEKESALTDAPVGTISQRAVGKLARGHNEVVAEYDLLKDLPEPLQTSLPSIEQIERELRSGGDS